MQTFNTNYQDTGLFGVYMTAPDNKLDDLMWYLMNNLMRLVHKVTPEELARAKTQLKARYVQLVKTQYGIPCNKIHSYLLLIPMKSPWQFWL